MVYGLPSEFPTGTPGGRQEDALNDLIKSLGIILKQAHIVGAHPDDTTTRNDKSSVIRLTVNSRDTKETIRKAAEATHRWGSGHHTVFLRDIVKRKRTSSNEDPRTPKKKKLDQRTESSYEERTRIGRARLDEEIKRREELKKLKAEQLEARLLKLARQDEEDKKTQEIIDKQGQVAKVVKTKKNMPSQSSKIKPFRALNEVESEEDEDSQTLSKTGPQGKSEPIDGHEDPGEPLEEETTRDDTKSEGSVEPGGCVELEYGSEIDRDDDEEYEYDEDDEDLEDPTEEPSPEREVIFKTSTKNAGRQRRRRKRNNSLETKKRSPLRQESRKTSDQDTKVPKPRKKRRR